MPYSEARRRAGSAPSIPTLAERTIRRRIARAGSITFAEYMSRALYGPGGYYTRQTGFGDYYTSPQVHPAFGALLAVQLFHFWSLLDRPERFLLVEPGAGNGLLCRDILDASRDLPEGFSESLQYFACDLRRAAGHESGSRHAHRVAADAMRLPFRAGAGCVLSNELLDALPVHRVRMLDGQLRELYVGLEPDVGDGYEGALTELAAEPSTPMLERRLSDLDITLAEGQTAEICLLLDDWAASVAGALDAGFVMTIDYGRDANDLYDPVARPDGTLVTYRSHRQTDAPLADAGRQDITAQVDFTSAQMVGERVGLAAVGDVPQGWLLSRLGLQTLRRRGPPSGGGGAGWITIPTGPEGALPDHWAPDPSDTWPDDGRSWLTGLTHLARPGGLGDFRVLVQSKGISPERAAAAFSWLDGDPAKHGYSPAALAGMIRPKRLELGPERVRLRN